MDKIQIRFGHTHQLKNLWQAGHMPSVKYGIYGDLLTRDNVTLEHLVPVSRSGATNYWNLALATKEKNVQRGSKDIFMFTDIEKIKQYLAQFRGIQIVDTFDGDRYIRGLLSTLKKIKEGRF